MMPASIDEYFRDLLDQIAASAIVRASDLNFDKRSSTVGFKHTVDGVEGIPSRPPDLNELLSEIGAYIP